MILIRKKNLQSRRSIICLDLHLICEALTIIACSAGHSSLSLCISTDVSIDILEELDLTHLRATGLQSCEEELPEAEQAPPGIIYTGICYLANPF